MIATMEERDLQGFSTAQVEAIRDGLARRTESADRRGLRGLDQVEIEVLAGLDYRARNPHEIAEMSVGEPTARGGSGEGSSPLSHFLAGTASCLLNQFIRVAAADELPVRFTGASARVEFSRAVGGGLERITTAVRGEGSLGDGAAGVEAAQGLVERAERLCYIHVTLRLAVRMRTVLILDGVERARSDTGPAAG